MTAEEKAAELYPYAATGTIHWAQQVLKQEGFLSGANWKESQHEWVSVKDRLPNEADAISRFGKDFVQVIAEFKGIRYVESWIWQNVKNSDIEYWRTPLPNNFPSPPKTEI
jgi:hypothetical protein